MNVLKWSGNESSDGRFYLRQTERTKIWYLLDRKTGKERGCSKKREAQDMAEYIVRQEPKGKTLMEVID